MLDPRIYRMGLVPVVLAVIVLAFSLTNQPAALTTSLAPDAYSGSGAYATMTSLAAQFPRRAPGSVADRRLGRLVAAQLRSDQFSVSTDTFSGITAVGARRLENVIGVRAGQQNGSIVVVAPRDSLGAPATTQLSGTAVLLALAQVLSGETLQHTVILASTTGSAGGAGALELARSLPQPVDAVIALGDLGGRRIREPVVVPWSDSEQVAPPLLRNTVAGALQSQAGVAPGATSLLGQLAHLALPVAATEQAPLDGHGLPAVLLSLSSERQPAADEPPSQAALAGTGRAVLQAVNALDGVTSVPAPGSYLTFSGKSVPAWAISLLGLALILPVLLASIDGLARARRRGSAILPWVGWVLAGAVPVITAALVAMAASAVGAIHAAPPVPLAGDTIKLGSGQLAFLAVLACLVAGGYAWLRAWTARHAGRRRGSYTYGEGAAAAVLSVMCLVAVVLWVANPFAALLVAPALHLWLWVVAPEVRLPAAGTIVMVLAGLALPLLVAAEYCLSLGLGPLQALWSWVLLLGGGGYGLVAAVAWSLFLGCAASVVAMALSTAREARPEPIRVTVRGPVTYAGPGSLGGTKSALRR